MRDSTNKRWMMMGDGGMQRVVEPKIPVQNRRCRRRRGGRGLADWDVGARRLGSARAIYTRYIYSDLVLGMGLGVNPVKNSDAKTSGHD